MPLHMVHQDITALECGAIVNPTDPGYSGSGGTDLAVHCGAGPELDAACGKLERLSCGDVAVTEGYRLPCRYIIHTCGPVWEGGGRNESVLLRSCYLNALYAAARLGAESVAFPLISSGTFGFPKDRVLHIALGAIGDYLNQADPERAPEVYLCVFDRAAYALSRQVDLDRYLEQSGKKPSADCESLEEWLGRKDSTFSLLLDQFLAEKKMKPSECYNRANVSKQTFSKIMGNIHHTPEKRTALALAIGLKLSLEETRQLLGAAGYSLSHSSTSDLIVEYYIARGIYDIYEVNAALYQKALKTLT